MNIAKLIQI